MVETYTTRRAQEQPVIDRNALSTYCAALRTAEIAKATVFGGSAHALTRAESMVTMPTLRGIAEAVGLPLTRGYNNPDGSPMTYEINFEGVRFYAFTNYAI